MAFVEHILRVKVAAEICHDHFLVRHSAKFSDGRMDFGGAERPASESAVNVGTKFG